VADSTHRRIRTSRTLGAWGRRLGAGTAALAVLVGFSGCETIAPYPVSKPSVSFPAWFSAPSAEEQRDTPVNMGMILPPHLTALAQEYALPGWVVYGVVRCLGADELHAQGTLKTFAVQDALGESRAVVDNIHYDVPAGQAAAVLSRISAAYGAAENEVDRQIVLGNYVKYRYGGFILFSLNTGRNVRPGDERAESLLLGTGEWDGATELFEPGQTESMPRIGWQETASHYVVTQPGMFRYGSPVAAFRKTEEDAIYELAKSILFKLSRLEKSAVQKVGNEETETTIDDVNEAAWKEEVSVRMRGVRVVRRFLDVDNGLCLVVVRVPKSGVSTPN